MTDADPPTDAAGPSSASKIAAEAAAPGVRRRRTPLTLVSELTGSLPCVRCSYDLKGLSILALCPECGTPIRATLLAVVDPKAGELQPIYHPRITATGLVAWSTAALLSLLCGWGVLLTEALPSGEIDRYLPALRYVSLFSWSFRAQAPQC